MSLTMRVGLLAGACVIVTSTGTGFADNGAEDRELQARIAQLEAEVAQLRGDDWLTETRAEEIRSLVQDVLADADTRASLLQNAATSGYDDGFMIASPDGNFSLKLNGQLQTRFIWNTQDNAPNIEELAEDLLGEELADDVGDVAAAVGFGLNDGDDHRWGFENTRTKLIFSGNVGSPEWLYYVEGDFGRFGGFTLDDAWIAYDAGNGWTVMMGQFKAPHQREWNVHSMNQLAVERSNVSYLFSGGRVQGLALDYQGEQFHFVASYNDGAFSQNSPWSTYDTEFSISGRAEVLLSGTWEQFEDFTSPRGSEQGFLVGGGVHYQKFEYGTLPAIDQLETFIVTGDFSAEFDGWNGFASVNYVDIDGIDANPLGFTVQGGYYFTEVCEGFARYEYTDFDIEGVEDWNIVTVGVNAYYNANVKMTTDFGYAFDALPLAFDVTGYRIDDPAEDGQFVFRSQLQLVF